MKIGKIERVERTTYALELEKDFTETDLEVIVSSYKGTLKGLSKEFRDNFYNLKIGRLVFSGHYDEETQTVTVQTEKEIFI